MVVDPIFIPSLVLNVGRSARLHRVVPSRLPEAFGEHRQENDGNSP